MLVPTAQPNHRLHNHVAEHGRTAASLQDGLRMLLSDRRSLLAWIIALSVDSVALDRIARESYWHANGFAKLVLDNGPGFRVRLHVWPAGSDRLGEPDPHSHRWDFASTVLVGDGLDVVEWEPGETGKEFHRYDYDGTELTHSGPDHLSEKRAYTVTSADTYMTDASVVHTVVPHGGDALVATLLLQGPRRSETTVVYREPGAPSQLPDASRGMSADEVAELLVDVTAGFPLNALGERRIISTILAPRYAAVSGFGDDCAVVAQPPDGEMVVTTDSCSDALVATLTGDDPFATGWLLVTMNLSDIAAAGALPTGLVVNYTLPPDTTVGWLRLLLDGVDACAREHGTRVVGGDLRDGPVRLLTATAFGTCPTRSIPGGAVPTRLGRHGARAGDILVLVGSPGWLWAWVLAEKSGVRLDQADADLMWRRARLPRACTDAGRELAARGLARAAMDVSDGLHTAVETLASLNGLGATVHAEIELAKAVAHVAEALGVGSLTLGQMWGDWNLLVAVAPEDLRSVLEMSIEATEIGRLTAEPGLWVDGFPAEPWHGLPQERFSTDSWNSGGIDAMIARLQAGFE